MSRPVAYARAGVDVEAGDRAVELIRETLGAGARGDLLGPLGGFAAAFPLRGSNDVLVSATDGVGTKTEIARALRRWDTIGQDLVAMCADDVACHGARPLFFLDYLAMGRVDPERVAGIVGGIAAACGEIGCALIGGETAEHPDVMAPDAFDLAGFCVGIASRTELVDGRAARAGDAVVGLAASGLHANGYSLVRALVERHALDLATPLADMLRERLGEAGSASGDGRTLGEALLEPTRLYAGTVLRLRDILDTEGARLGGIAHITGGGLGGNLPRAVGPALAVEVDPRSWPAPALVRLFGHLAGIGGAELRATFNGGVGMALVVEPGVAASVVGWLGSLGVESWVIGRVVRGGGPGAARYTESTAR